MSGERERVRRATPRPRRVDFRKRRRHLDVSPPPGEPEKVSRAQRGLPWWSVGGVRRRGTGSARCATDPRLASRDVSATTFSPVVLAERDSEDRGVDLAGLRVPSSRDAEDGRRAAATSVVVCRVCHRAYAKYTCPRCHTRYCALACYKAHDARCVESFHGDALGDAMRGLVVDDDEAAMAALLRAARPDGRPAARAAARAGARFRQPPPATTRSSVSSRRPAVFSERGGDDDAFGERATGGHKKSARTRRRAAPRGARCPRRTCGNSIAARR